MDGTLDRKDTGAAAPRSLQHIFKALRLDEETKQDRLDVIIVKIFPYFMVACAILIAILTVYFEDYTFAGILYATCLGFASGFSGLGTVCLILSDKSAIRDRYTIAAVVLIPAVLAFLFHYLGPNFEPNGFLVHFFNMFAGTASLNSLLVSLYTIALMTFLVAHGIVSVIVGYFRSYLYRVLRALESPPDKRKNHIPEWIFQIPNIIDIETVELEPVEDDDKFNYPLFANTAVSLFLLGIVVCSYLFLNPVFLDVIPFDEMLIIGIFLSLFLSPLVIPWSIVRSIGAKITSSAPRDYYLWKGMRGRLYQGFFAITFFMMLLTLSAYLGMDFSRILATYVGYLVFMATISIVTSFVYVNTYYKGFKKGLIKSFILSKKK
ncbi:MAG: hypothetical protein LBV63_02770 [Candidatus Methanoplasma sp.]|jgi:hypothetical protein|nr:hypothetical protein [Candidatus Methanoplasma sp.]